MFGWGLKMQLPPTPSPGEKCDITVYRMQVVRDLEPGAKIYYELMRAFSDSS